MDDVERVRAAERAGDLPRDVERASLRERPDRDLVAQVLALHEFEHQENRAVGELAEVGRGGDVGVLDVRRRHRLALEPRDDLGHRGELAVQDLDREPLAHEHVLGGVDPTHATFAQQRVDAIAVREHGADALIRCHAALWRA